MAALTSDVSRMTTWAWLHRHAWECEGGSVKAQRCTSGKEGGRQDAWDAQQEARHASQPLAIVGQDASPAER